MTKNLFNEFSVSAKGDWEKRVVQDLRGKDFDSSLKSRLWEKIEVEPFYTSEDLQGKAPVQHRFQKESEIPGMPPRQWANMVSVFPGDSVDSVLRALQNGAEGLVLHLSGFEDLSEILKGVKPEYIPILIQPIGNPIAAINTFFTWIESLDVPSDNVTGGLLWSPSDLVFDHNGEYELAIEIFQELLELTESFPNFRSFAVKTSRYSESGGNPIDAVVFGLGELIELIDLSGESPAKVFQNMLLDVAVADHHFGEIARLKAFRMATDALGSLYSIELAERDLILLAKTAHWSKSILDVNSNLIRQTYEAMAAVLGGVNLLWTSPLHEESANDLERRIARNVSSILREEAYLDKVIDPASGSFFLEKIQAEILAEIQQGLRDLEVKGGWLAVLKSTEIHSKVKSHREKIQNAVSEKQISKIGVNKFVASGNLKNDLEFEFFEEKSYELKPTRATYLAEWQNQSDG
ncbi:hypothetical protein GCM10009119_36690 [Algoriphagus jejuensis]|uniref:Methylmalonyl-CoA mutase alpha/beta chain catalytic domain-containing protein n=1 Tax=Algoriphagus jejuensis TaxID=419934 RepID=A0ABN1N483_9BACT